MAFKLKNRIAPWTFHPAKVWVVMGLISIAFIWGGLRAQNRFGLLISFLLATGVDLLIVFYSDLILNSLYPSHEIEGNDPWGLATITTSLATTLKVHRPKLLLMKSSKPILFVTGIVPTHGKVFISEELLNRLSHEELRAIVAFELACLKIYQSRMTTAVAALASILVALAWIIDSILLLGWFRKKLANDRFHFSPTLFVLAPLISLMARLSLNRRVLLSADELAAKTVGNPGLLAQALWKIDAFAQARPLNVTPGHAQLFVVDPRRRPLPLSSFSPHPDVKQRIIQLVGHYPL
jgi:heat shock protein HtpX